MRVNRMNRVNRGHSPNNVKCGGPETPRNPIYTNYMPWPGWFDGNLTRRDALKLGALGAAGAWTADFSRRADGESETFEEPAPKEAPIVEGSGRGFRSIRLQAIELEKTANFYGSTLGLPVKRDGKNVVVTAGSTHIVFEPAKQKSVYHFAFNIPENKIETALEWTKRRTQVVNMGREIFHFESWNAHAIYFFDPAGNIVEFIARHTLPNASKGAFSVKEVLYASELGMVVDDVPKAVADIDKNLGMKPYRGASGEFAAVGDEHALLIVVKKGRLWFGTDDLPATTFPATAQILGAPTKSLVAGNYRLDLVSR
jgi:catechol-2,3-dioxygenase